MTETEAKLIKERIDKEETWLISILMKNDGIIIDDITTAMNGISHTIDIELLQSQIQEQRENNNDICLRKQY